MTAILEPLDRPGSVLAPPRERPALDLDTGYPDLDIWRAFAPGRLTFVDAPPDRACYRLLASATRAGEVMIVDGANRVDVYPLVDAAHALHLDPDVVLARSWIARAFTPYQMQALVEETGPHALAEGKVLLVVSGIADAYLDEDTPKREGLVLYRRALRELARTARESGAVVIATNHSSALHRRRGWLDVAIAAAGETVTFGARARGACEVRLLARGVTVLARDHCSAEATLDSPRFARG